MSLLEDLQQFRGSSKLIINQKYIDDKGAKQIARFIQEHGKLEYLQLKSNDISGIGFAQIFKALQKNINIRQIIIEHNRLGQQGTDFWPICFGQLINKSSRIERLNFSNNKLGGRSFSQMRTDLSKSKSLKLLQLRYNQIPTSQINSLIDELRSSNNQTLLYVELAGNKIDRDVLTKLQQVLKKNRQKNPIPKDNLMMAGTGGFNARPIDQRSFQSQSKFSRNNAIDELSKQNVLRHLEDLLDQSRRGTIELKNRFEDELSELQKKQKQDASQIIDLDRKCNQLTIANRNINFELEKTVQENRQIQMDLEYQARVKEQRIHEANRQLTEMQLKYQEIENKMTMEHQAKLKQIGRVWELRLRAVENKIRNIQTEQNSIDNQIQKVGQKRQKLRADYEEQENALRHRIQEQQSQRYRLKLQVLEAKVRQIESSRQSFYKRGDDINYQFESTQNEVISQIQRLQIDLQQLKKQQGDLVNKNKDFMARNQMIKQDITVKQVAIEKLEEEVNRVNQQIEHRKVYNREQIDKIIEAHESDRLKRGGQKKGQIQKMGDLEATLRKYQLENAKLEQQYKILQQKLQIAISKGVQEVFAENHLY